MHQLFIDFKKAYDSVRSGGQYNNLIEFGIPMKLVKLIKMCLTKTYNRARVGMHLSGTVPVRNHLKQGDVLSPLLLKFVLEYAIRKVRASQESLRLNGMHKLLVYSDNVNILGGSVRNTKKKRQKEKEKI